MHFANPLFPSKECCWRDVNELGQPWLELAHFPSVALSQYSSSDSQWHCVQGAEPTHSPVAVSVVDSTHSQDSH